MHKVVQPGCTALPWQYCQGSTAAQQRRSIASQRRSATQQGTGRVKGPPHSRMHPRRRGATLRARAQPGPGACCSEVGVCNTQAASAPVDRHALQIRFKAVRGLSHLPAARDLHVLARLEESPNRRRRRRRRRARRAWGIYPGICRRVTQVSRRLRTAASAPVDRHALQIRFKAVRGLSHLPAARNLHVLARLEERTLLMPHSSAQQVTGSVHGGSLVIVCKMFGHAKPRLLMGMQAPARWGHPAIASAARHSRLCP